MKIETIESDPLRARCYLERYVNDGSPSGFTETHRVSPITDPFGLTPWFHPSCLQTKPSDVEDFGQVPILLPMEEQLGENWFIVHPDMIGHSDLDLFQVQVADNLRVTPTSSARTVQILGSTSLDYIKLHYDGLIGRIDRKLPYAKAISGPEISQHILDAIYEHRLPDSLCILHETGAKMLKIGSSAAACPQRHWGLVWREGIPRGHRADQISYLIPLFSLWSFDRLQSYDPPILSQLCKLWRSHAYDNIYNGILAPILDSYFSLVLNLGFQIELNGQNVLAGFNSKWEPIAVVFRDTMGTEKDLTLRMQLGLSVDFKSSPYKVIRKEDGEDLYRIRHSFVFDFKVSTYVLDPIVKLASTVGGVDYNEVTSQLKVHTNKWVNKLPEDYFPTEGKWYKHDKTLLNNQRPYVAEFHPKYR